MGTFEQDLQRRLLSLMRGKFPDRNLPDGTEVVVDMGTDGFETSGYYAVIDVTALSGPTATYSDLGQLIRDLDAQGLDAGETRWVIEINEQTKALRVFTGAAAEDDQR